MMNLATSKEGKVIFIDFGITMFTAIFAWYGHRQGSPCYTAITMILSNLKKVGLDKEDLVIIAVDSPSNWRKDVDVNYKANRKAGREKYDIDWNKQFEDFAGLLLNLKMYTPFHILKVNKMEADDIIAYGVRKFKDRECVIISSDSDYEQLAVFDNVKIFSPKSKRYKHINDPLAILAQKIHKETADNLVTEVVTEQDYQIRNMIVNLMELPEMVEEAVDEVLRFLPEKDWHYEKIFYMKSLSNRYYSIYEKDKVVDFNKKLKSKKPKMTTKKTTYCTFEHLPDETYPIKIEREGEVVCLKIKEAKILSDWVNEVIDKREKK